MVTAAPITELEERLVQVKIGGRSMQALKCPNQLEVDEMHMVLRQYDPKYT